MLTGGSIVLVGFIRSLVAFGNVHLDRLNKLGLIHDRAPSSAATQEMPLDRRRESAFSGRAFGQEACPLESSDKVCPGRRQLWPSLPGCYRPRTQRPVRQCSCVVVHLGAVNRTAMDENIETDFWVCPGSKPDRPRQNSA